MTFEEKTKKLSNFRAIYNYVTDYYYYGDRAGTIRKNVVEYKEIADKTLIAIVSIGEPLLIDILLSKYVYDLSFRQIGENLHYCEKQITRLHKKAVDMLDLEGIENVQP